VWLFDVCGGHVHAACHARWPVTVTLLLKPPANATHPCNCTTQQVQRGRRGRVAGKLQVNTRGVASVGLQLRSDAPQWWGLAGLIPLVNLGLDALRSAAAGLRGGGNGGGGGSADDGGWQDGGGGVEQQQQQAAAAAAAAAAEGLTEEQQAYLMHLLQQQAQQQQQQQRRA
jgi:hypothetical protein